MKKLAGGLAALSALAAATSASAAPVLWDVASGGNGHYYEVIGLPTPADPTPASLSWSAALIDAAGRSHLGLQGYLVTITSAAEHDFLLTYTSSFWTAGSDADAEGVWKWTAGPEAGQVFWNGATVTYANWSPGEPGNTTAQNALRVQGTENLWFDAAAFERSGYVVEYGGLEAGVPEPATWAMMIMGFGAAGVAVRRRRATA